MFFLHKECVKKA